MTKWRKKPSAALAFPPWKEAGPSRPEAMLWRIRCTVLRWWITTQTKIA
jgi:hypothetical protein